MALKKLLDVGEKFPKPFRRLGANVIIQTQRYRGKNYFDSYWDGHQFRFGYWDRVTLRKAKHVVRDGMIDHEQIPIEHFELDSTRDAAIDIGAHFGFYTVVLATLNPDMEIHAFEPEGYNTRILDLNLAMNNHKSSRVQIHQKVVSDSTGTMDFYTDPRPEGTVSHTINPSEEHHSDHKEIEIESVSAGGFCSERGIQNPWVKVDAEGAELEILADLFTTDSIESVMGFAELHLNRKGVTRDAYHDLLRDHGYVTTEMKGRAKETNPGFLFAPEGREYWK